MFSTEKYEIDIDYHPTYKSGSADNLFKFDFEYLENNKAVSSTIFGIKILENGSCQKSAVISAEGGETGVHNSALVIDEDRLTLCCGNKIFCLSIPDLTLLWKIQADDFTCFQIFAYQDSYIVHGEINISRINHDGTILWQYSGEDIFMNMDEEVECELREDYIIATDFNNKVYKIGYDGKDYVGNIN
jgi:outer membrane protein assembly factor BamB